MLRVSLHLQKTGTSSWQQFLWLMKVQKPKEVAQNMQLYTPEENECCAQIAKFHLPQTIN